jgi:hypothetical protein
MNSTLVSPVKSDSKLDLSMSEKNGTYLFRLPYIYKDLFRTIFKSAVWNSIEKAFVAKANTANKNKWQRFIEAANGLSDEMATAAEAEATAEDLQSLLTKTESMRTELQRKISECKSKTVILNAQIAQSKKLVIELSPIAESAAAAVADLFIEVNQAKEKLLAATAPARSIFVANNVEDIFTKMMRSGRRGYLGKSDLQDAQEELKTVSRQLLSVGYEHSLIDRICNHSLNRPDKFENDVPRARESLLTGLTRTEIS